MKICVTGNGNIGSRLVQAGCEPLSLNLLDEKSVHDAVQKEKPDLIIHTAGISSPEACEKEPELARYTNVRGTAHLGEAALDCGARILYISTDHIFDGRQGDCAETDEPNPISEYGRTKFAAEGLVQLYEGKILRLSRGFDKNSADIQAYESAVRSGGAVYIPDFIRRSYSHFDHLVSGILVAASKYDELPDILHIASSNSMMFYDFVVSVATAKGWASPSVLPRGYEDDGFAPRPLLCGLDTSLAKELGIPIFSTQESIGLL